MNIFIIFSSQKTRGPVAGNLARLHATHIARPSRLAWYRALNSVAHIYLRAACLHKEKSAKLCWKCKQRPKLRSVKFHFWSFFSRKWRCILYLTLCKDVYQLFVRQHSHCNLRINGIGNNNSIKWRKMSLFLLSWRFFTFQFGGFLAVFQTK